MTMDMVKNIITWYYNERRKLCFDFSRLSLLFSLH